MSLRILRPLLLLLALLAAVVPAGAQMPGLANIVTGGGKTSEPAPAEVTADRQADAAALDRLLTMLKDDAQRTALVKSLEEVRAGLESGKAAAAPAEAAPAAPAEGLIGALTDSVNQAAQDLPTAALGTSLDQKVANATGEFRERMASGFGGEATLAFLAWALPGVALTIVLMVLLFRNRWLHRRRTLRRRPTTRVGLLRAVVPKLLFGLVPWLAAVLFIFAWSAQFSSSWRDTQIFIALTSPFVVPVLVRQLVSYALLLLGPSRGWRLVGYAQQRLLRWIFAVVAIGVAAGLMREFAVRLVIGRNTADLAALALDLLAAGVFAIFVLRQRLTVRSLILKGRRNKSGDQGAGILTNVINAFANYWHIFAILFLVANVGARLFGIGGDNFLLDAVIAISYILLGLVFLAALNAFFSREGKELARRKGSIRHALAKRYLEVLHLFLQAITFAVVAIACIDLWGFGVGNWLTTRDGARVLQPVASILAVPLLVWIVWITVDTSIEQALAPTDNFGRQRHQSARIKTLLPLLRNIVLAALCVITGIAILANLGVNVAPLLAGAGIIGLAISFGSQQLVQDVITGFFFLFEDAIAIGDVVTTGTQSGVVEAINIRTVKIRAGNGALHSVPFSQIKTLQNDSRDYGVYLLTVTVGYEADADRAMEIMREIGGELLQDPAYGFNMLAPIEIWGVDGFTVDGVVIKGAMRCRPLQQWGVGREFNRRMKHRFDSEGIVFYRPQQRIEISDARALRQEQALETAAPVSA